MVATFFPTLEVAQAASGSPTVEVARVALEDPTVADSGKVLSGLYLAIPGSDSSPFSLLC